jgi:hypothetical protein
MTPTLLFWDPLIIHIVNPQMLITIFTLNKIPLVVEFFRSFGMEKCTQVSPDVLAQLCPIFFATHMLKRNLKDQNK